MNVFIGVGRIKDINIIGRLLKFSLVLKQEKPCRVPCILFDPDEDVKRNVGQLEESKKIVWLKGRASTYEFEVHGKPLCRFEIVAYPGSIKPI